MLLADGLVSGLNGSAATGLDGMKIVCPTIERGWSSTENVHLMDTTRAAMAGTAAALASNDAAGEPPFRAEVYSGVFPFMDGIKVMRIEMYLFLETLPSQ